ncbi:MAG: PilZ domain-containing protein [Pseudomonadota bacterium]
MMNENMKEAPQRRIFPRRHFKTKVIFEDEYGEDIFYLNSKDISLGGMFLEYDVPLKLGSLLFLSFSLPGFKKPFHFTAEVVRVATFDHAESGIGVRWLGLGQRVIDDLKRFLADGE